MKNVQKIIYVLIAIMISSFFTAGFYFNNYTKGIGQLFILSIYFFAAAILFLKLYDSKRKKTEMNSKFYGIIIFISFLYSIIFFDTLTSAILRNNTTQNIVIQSDNKIISLFQIIYLFFAIFFMFNLVFSILCLICYHNRKYYSIFGAVMTILLFGGESEIFLTSGIVLLIVTVCYSCIASLFSFNKEIDAKTKQRTLLFVNGGIFTYVVTLFITFFVFGSRLFLIGSVSIPKNIALYFALVIWMIPIISFVLSCLKKLENILNQPVAVSKKKYNWLCFGISLTLGLLISIAIYQMNFFQTKEGIVEIIPSGEKNEASQGYEILLNSVIIEGKSFIPEEFNNLPDGWSNVNGMIIGDGSSKLTLHLPKSKDIKLIFNKHLWSGIIQLKEGDSIKKVDLYSGNGISYLYSYQLNSNHIYEKGFTAILFMAAITIGLVFIIFLIIRSIFRVWNQNVSVRFFTIVICLEMLLIFLFYIIASYPASICFDSRTQLLQVNGFAPITDAHPAIYTLLIKLLLSIFHSVSAVAVLQACFFTSVAASILRYLYIQGSNRKILLIVGMAVPLFLNNGIYVTTIFKDVPYTIFILLLTYQFYRIGKENTYLNKPFSIILVGIALAGCRLFRHNGIIIFAAGLILLAILWILRKKACYLITLILSVALVSGIRGPLYQIAGVQEVEGISENSSSMAPLLHGIVYAGIQEKLPESTNAMLKKLMPMEEWKLCYTPFCINDLFMSELAVNNQIKEKLSEIGVTSMLKNYIRSFLYSPYTILSDRLYGIDLLWNVFRDNGYNWRVSNNTYEVGIIDNDLQLYRKDNIITEIIKPIAEKTMENTFLDVVFWRGGFWLAGLCLIFRFALLKKKNLFVLIPCAANIVSLGLSMMCQDYRYVYFLSMSLIFIILLILSDNDEKNVFEEQKLECTESRGKGR